MIKDMIIKFLTILPIQSKIVNPGNAAKSTENIRILFKNLK